jgi:hypothetical protein
VVRGVVRLVAVRPLLAVRRLRPAHPEAHEPELPGLLVVQGLRPAAAHRAPDLERRAAPPQGRRPWLTSIRPGARAATTAGAASTALPPIVIEGDITYTLVSSGRGVWVEYRGALLLEYGPEQAAALGAALAIAVRAVRSRRPDLLDGLAAIATPR